MQDDMVLDGERRARGRASEHLAPNENHLRYLSAAEPPPLGVREYLLDRDDYRIRLADCAGQRSEVSMLIHRMYSWRGYSVAPPVRPGEQGNQITFEASSGDALFGTVTLTLDGDEGLAADELYRPELDAFRGPKRLLAELTRLAVDPRHNSKEILASLFHLAFIYGRILRGATDVFIEVNPRHVKFYERMLGLNRVGPQRMCKRVNAPAVLMHGDLDHVEQQIARFGGGQGGPDSHSLYPYFFSSAEEKGLVNRIWHCCLTRIAPPPVTN